jgi:hypothetical protein
MVPPASVCSTVDRQSKHLCVAWLSSIRTGVINSLVAGAQRSILTFVTRGFGGPCVARCAGSIPQKGIDRKLYFRETRFDCGEL